MDITIWRAKGSEFFAEWLTNYTSLKKYKSSGNLIYKDMSASDANNRENFFRMPARIKDILYLDSPDVIISVNDFPLLSIEFSLEAGTGHNAFQRFSRIAAAVESGCGAIYIYPEATWVSRKKASRWDRINPLIFRTLESIMQLYQVPAFIYYHPSDFGGSLTAKPSKTSSLKGHHFDPDSKFIHCPDSRDSQMKMLFKHVDETLKLASTVAPQEVGEKILKQVWARDHRLWMQGEWTRMNQGKVWSPETATLIVDTKLLLNYLSKYKKSSQDFGSLLPSRKETLLYLVDAKFRGDPYTGCIAALDYLKCRQGPTYEDRVMNLAIVWGSVKVLKEELEIKGEASVNDYVGPVQSLYKDKNAVLLSLSFKSLIGRIPRYMMQVRHGTTYTKKKELRIYAYFADAILFEDGALWREA